MMKNTIFIEFDNSKLRYLSEQLYNLFKNNSYNTILLNNQSIFETDNSFNPFILSNKLNDDNSNAIEIIYPLRSNDNLAKQLSDKLSSIVPVTKYYQLRSNNNTKLDYYEIFQNTNTNAIIIKYGENIINNEKLPLTIFQTINSYLNNANVYLVKSGDSLYAISKKFNTTVDEIKKINNLTSNNLSIGQKLIIPSNENIDQNIYTVQSGDSLYAISKKFNTTVYELKKINNLTSNNLAIGQKIIIPTSENLNQNIYTVQKGDSLYAISKKFNTTVDKLKELNNFTSNTLSIGQKLLIP